MVKCLLAESVDLRRLLLIRSQIMSYNVEEFLSRMRIIRAPCAHEDPLILSLPMQNFVKSNGLDDYLQQIVSSQFAKGLSACQY